VTFTESDDFENEDFENKHAENTDPLKSLQHRLLAPEQEQEPNFERLFKLEEAAKLLPEITQAFEKAHQQLAEIRDEIIMYKRFQVQREKEKQVLSEAETDVLKQKWHTYEEIFSHWIQYFVNQGILLRDLERGLIDFPYQSSQGDYFFLCWQFGEEGLFYFHPIEEGFSGREPISLLPD
jgi:hypothetical protein